MKIISFWVGLNSFFLMLFVHIPPSNANEQAFTADLELTANILTMNVIFALHLIFYFGLFLLAAILGNRHLKKSDYWAKASNYDSLTGLLNRRGLQHILEQHHGTTDDKQHLQSGFLILIDIDNFKQINDGFGHDQGDIVLKKVAETLQTTCRSDDVICRLGGEEFLIFSTNLSSEQAQQQATRLVQSVEAKVKKVSSDATLTSMPVTISAGVAPYVNPLKWELESYKLADAALYHAKHLGKNRACYAEKLSEISLCLSNLEVLNS